MNRYSRQLDIGHARCARHGKELLIGKILNTLVVIVLCIGMICIEHAVAEVNEEGTVSSMFDQVVSFRAQGRYDTAVEILLQIIQDNPQNEEVLRRAYNELVFTHLSKGDRELAEASAREALMWHPDITSDTKYVPSKVGEIFDELREQLFGSLTITTDPNSCRVELNGTYIGESPLEIEYMRPGEHGLRLTMEGYYEFSRTVSVEPGIKTKADYSLEKIVIGPRSGFGLGGGIVIPYKDANKYEGTGLTIQGFGSLGFPSVSFAIIRASVQGLFFGEEEIGGKLIEDAATKKVSNNILKLSLGVEFFRKSHFLETFVGAGTGIQYIWNSLDFLDQNGNEVDSWTLTSNFSRGWSELFLGLNLNAGIRLYFARSVAFDLYAQYDWIPNVRQVNEDLENIAVHFESFSIIVNIYFGRTHGGR